MSALIIRKPAGEWKLKKPPADMLALAQTVLPHAYAPYSRFLVAACVRTTNGECFSGCNVENAAFPSGICAEAGAISALIAHGYHTITEALILVSDNKICTPCGACRQRFLEHASKNTIIHLCTQDGQYQYHTVEELLPFAFGPNNLEKSL